MKIGITGITGLIGRALSVRAAEKGHEVVGFSRRPNAIDVEGCREMRTMEPLSLNGLDAVVNLAGESIMGVWTRSKKERIRRSRVEVTRAVVEALREPGGPRVLVNGSAIGIYGDTGNGLKNETSPPGRGFLAEVAQAWEAEAVRAEPFGTRVVRLRIGFVLGRQAPSVRMIRRIFRAGLGGRLGSGRQGMSCVHIDDVVGMILWSLEREDVHGPLNAVLPEPSTNAEFTRLVARVCGRPAWFPVPAFVLRLALGELSNLVLDSQRVEPAVAREMGYRHAFPTLKSAVEDVFRV